MGSVGGCVEGGGVGLNLRNLRKYRGRSKQRVK
jgi:hypothetical protein